MGDGHQAVDERGGQGLHPLDRDALADLGEHRREARELVFHLAGPLPHVLAEQQLTARRQRDGGDRIRQRPLVRYRERADLIHLVAEEVHAVGVLGGGREHIEDAAAHGELAAPRHHVDARIREVDELQRESRQVEAAGPHRELDRRIVREIVGEGLQSRAHGRHDDDRPGAVTRIPLRQPAERGEPLADDLGARAQAFVGKRLPRRELDDFGVRQHAPEGAPDRLGFPPGRRDDE